MIGWSVLAVELPFLLGMGLVQVLVRCAHCRGVWLTFWPVLPGAIPSYIFGARFGGWRFPVALGLITLGFVVGVFLLSYQSRFWRFILVVSGLLFCLLAAVTHALIAA